MCKFLISHFPSFSGEGTDAERALRVLDHFWCVYFLERFDETTQPIFEQLNIAPRNTSWNIRESHAGDGGSEIDISAAQLDQDIILYETALLRFSEPRPLSTEAQDRLDRFRSEPFRPQKWRKFFYGVSYEQFRDANVLDDVIAHRKRMISELEAELSAIRSYAGANPAAQRKSKRATPLFYPSRVCYSATHDARVELKLQSREKTESGSTLDHGKSRSGTGHPRNRHNSGQP